MLPELAAGCRRRKHFSEGETTRNSRSLPSYTFSLSSASTHTHTTHTRAVCVHTQCHVTRNVNMNHACAPYTQATPHSSSRSHSTPTTLTPTTPPLLSPHAPLPPPLPMVAEDDKLQDKMLHRPPSTASFPQRAEPYAHSRHPTKTQAHPRSDPHCPPPIPPLVNIHLLFNPFFMRSSENRS